MTHSSPETRIPISSRRTARRESARRTYEDVRIAAFAVALAAQQANRDRARVLTTIPSGWRNNPSAMQEVRFRHRDEAGGREIHQGPNGEFPLRRRRAWRRGAGHCARSNGWIELEIDGVQRVLHVTREGARHWVQSSSGRGRARGDSSFPGAGTRADRRRLCCADARQDRRDERRSRTGRSARARC